MLRLGVGRVHLPSDIPIVGCELSPYVLVRRPDNTTSREDIPESAPVDGHFLRYKWYRIVSDKKVEVCSVHPTEQATLQCTVCLKCNIHYSKSYHCSAKCYRDAWQHHRAIHDRFFHENGEDGVSVRSSSGSGAKNSSSSTSSLADNAPVAQKRGNETWFEVGQSKTYTPSFDDVGNPLMFECVVVDVKTKLPVGHPSTLTTSHVIPAPTPIPRRLISVNGVDTKGRLDLPSNENFTVLSYNVLADVYASSEVYNYCPAWALSWPYRRQNLLREIVGYHADIICLQEVQNEHFEDFFSPELDKHGYQPLYKRKTSEVSHTHDGCATFFRRDRFSHVKKYDVEFNKAAQSLTETVIPVAQKKDALARLVKDNVALIAVLEAKFSHQGADNLGKRQLLCVANTHVHVTQDLKDVKLWQANTHVHVTQDLKDVKLWQVHTLLKGLEKIAASADIPMLVCGDFNTTPGSAPHSLLALGKVESLHRDLAMDPLGILRPHSKLSHQLLLVSAYSSFGVGPNMDLQRRKMDPSTNEPLFTYCTRDFIGTYDYIFYTADSLAVESLLELLDEESLRKDTALPSPEWSSDHIALLAEFRCKPRRR